MPAAPAAVPPLPGTGSHLAARRPRRGGEAAGTLVGGLAGSTVGTLASAESPRRATYAGDEPAGLPAGSAC